MFTLTCNRSSTNWSYALLPIKSGLVLKCIIMMLQSMKNFKRKEGKEKGRDGMSMEGRKVGEVVFFKISDIRHYCYCYSLNISNSD